MHPPIVRCNVCGLVYANPRWDSNVVSDSYSVVEDPTYVDEREGRVLTFSRNLTPFERCVPADSKTRRLLDVGCHIGVMVELAQQRGWEAWGVEPSTWASEQARARGLHVVTGTLDGAEIPADYFDVVTMWDVIEHFTDPVRRNAQHSSGSKARRRLCDSHDRHRELVCPADGPALALADGNAPVLFFAAHAQQNARQMTASR